MRFVKLDAPLISRPIWLELPDRAVKVHCSEYPEVIASEDATSRLSATISASGLATGCCGVPRAFFYLTVFSTDWFLHEIGMDLRRVKIEIA